MARGGAVIHRVIKIRGLKKKDVAAAVDISASTMNRILNDAPSVEVGTVARLAAYLGLTYDMEKDEVVPPTDLPRHLIHRNDRRGGGRPPTRHDRIGEDRYTLSAALTQLARTNAVRRDMFIDEYMAELVETNVLARDATPKAEHTIIAGDATRIERRMGQAGAPEAPAKPR